MSPGKEITVVLYRREFENPDWSYPVDEEALARFIEKLSTQLETLAVRVQFVCQPEQCARVRGYGDLLNAVRLRSPQDNIANLCLGHILGSSDNRDLFEDIRRGVTRVAFAPEMIEPEGSNKIVCHNCGCGC
ncbi:MAG: hypothetical protein P1P74_00555 [Desulfuromonadales bacterium]|nr:hypothetical protein [Desulfuromonadales bacterium]